MGTWASNRLIAGVVSGRGKCLVNLSIGPAESTVLAAKKHGHAIAPAQRFVGLVDTGCNALEIDQSIVARLGLIHIDMRETTTASGRVNKLVYPISLSVVTATGDVAHTVTDLEAREMPVLSPDFQVLIGWSVLRAARLSVEGPVQTFSMLF